MILPKTNRLTPEQLNEVTAIVTEFGCKIQPIIGAVRTIYAIVGDERDELMINRLEGLDYMSLRGPAGVLYDIVVDPAHRRGGVGRALLDATIASLEARGAPMVVLSTAERNEAAQRLFASAGFRRTMIEMTRDL